MSPTNLEKPPQPSLQGPRLENAGSFLIVGLRRHYTEDRISNIPAQWQQFVQLNAERAAALESSGANISERQQPQEGPGCRRPSGLTTRTP